MTITTTSQGAPMSPRMSALWTYLRSTLKIALTDFSTDECVAREYAKLAAAALLAPTAEIRKDIENLMRRVPANRIGADAPAMVAMTPAQRARHIVLAGTAAEGSGALAGWSGLGRKSRGDLISAFEAAGLPIEWILKTKSIVGYAGRAVNSLTSYGYTTRRARSADWHKASPTSEKAREYRARWIVFVNNTEGDVGDAAGKIQLTVEVRDGSDELHLEGDAELAQLVNGHFTASRDGEMYDSSDISPWLRGLLFSRCGATDYALGYYIPASGRELAQKLVAAVASTGFGHSWTNPLLPVATGPELVAGIAASFVRDVERVETTLATEKAKLKAGEAVSAPVAARLLKDLAKIDERADTYRALCGDDAMKAPAAALAALVTELSPIVSDASMRFALLELDGAPTAAKPVAPAPVAPAIRAAEKAAETKRAPKARTTEDYRRAYNTCLKASGTHPAAFKAACQAVLVEHGITEPTSADWARAAGRLSKAAAPVSAPAAPAPVPADDDASQRFSLLEMD